jgi:pilus assembly protein CpaF
MMGLNDRLAKRRGEGPDQTGESSSLGTSDVPAGAEPSAKDAFAQRDGDRKRSPYDDLKRRIHAGLLKSLGADLYDVDLSAQELERKVREELSRVLSEESTPLSAAERQQIVAESIDDILGFGPIEPFLRDPDITEIMCNGPHKVYIEKNGKLENTGVRFFDDAHLRRTMEKIVAQVGRRIDEAQPYVDARLPDGSRVNAIIPPVSIDGPALTVRRFSREPYTMDTLVGFGTFSEQAAEFMEACVEGRINVLVSGGTGTGKTTTLNALSGYIPHDERLVTIEDAAELKLQQPHIVRLEYRPPNIEGRGEITIRDLVRNALRMRPDRIVVGEVRGGEALDMLQAMNTGHEGSITTVHANSPRDVLSRLETMVLMAGIDLPVRAIREQIAAGIQIICHQSRMRDGSRRITHISELTGMEGDLITLQDIFRFDYSPGLDESGKVLGTLQATGIRPMVGRRLKELDIDLPAEMFAPPVAAAQGRRR